MIKLASTWLVLLIFFNLTFSETRKLPSIWKEDNMELKSYHIMAELEMIESGKIFMLEEWISVTKRLFRLDLIDSYGGARRTLLSNKYTNENFYYKPFECSLVPNFDKAFFPELVDKFKSDLDLLVPTGIGSLWLQSSEVDAGYLTSSFNDLSKIHLKTANNVLKNYIQYKVPSNGNGYKYRLDFFFRSGKEQLKNLALIHVLSTTEGTSKANVIMRIKLLEVETFSQSIDTFGEFEDVFDLPVAYGCQRGDLYDRSSAFPVNRYVPTYVPNILQLDVVSTQPADLDHDRDKWKTHQISVRIVKGRITIDSMTSNDYIILETQDYALKSQAIPTAISSDNGTKKVATLRRQKRVWDIGRESFTDPEKRAKYFEIDERTRKCTDFGEDKLKETVSIEFGISTKDIKTLQSGSEQTKTILTLNTELIDTLFTTTQGYHLIREIKPKSYPNLREAIYERRVDKFQLKDNKGNIVWSGPVSFVRRHSTKLKSDELRQTSSSMYFYSEDLTKLKGKIHINVVEQRTISEAYLHRELEDIGKICFAKIIDSNQENRQNPIYQNEETDKKSLDFVLSYPIDSQNVAEILAMSDRIEEVIYEKFIASMFAVSKGALNMLQLSDIDINFGPEMIKISAEISEVPELLNYWQDHGQKFSQSKQNLLFTERNIENEEFCARSCSNYNCYMFSYNSKSKNCDILLTKFEDNKHSRTGIIMTFEPDSSSSIFRPKMYPDSTTNSRTFISPEKFIEKLRQTLLTSKEGAEDNSLEFQLKYTSAKSGELEINLSPLFITSGRFNLQEFDELLGEENKKNDKNQIKAEYKIIYENKKYKDSLKISKDFPIQLAHHTSYNDCKSLCSEYDCRSFSHCKIESTCRVSMLHKLTQVRKFSEDEELCAISQRDYLSKFKQVSDEHVLKLRKISKTTEARNANDCASDCMDEEKFKCKSFYYCQSKNKESNKVVEEEVNLSNDNEFSCYLRKTHLAHLEEKPSKTNLQIQQRECHLYMRSYLVDFDKSVGLSISGIVNDNGQDSSEIIHGSGAEECAIQCANREGNCQAFQVCRTDTSYEPICTLLTRLVSLKEIPTLDSLLVGDDRCTSFLISKKSELNKFRDQEKIDEGELDKDNVENTETLETSHWFIELVLFLVGSSLGYLVTILIIKRSFDQARGQINLNGSQPSLINAEN